MNIINNLQALRQELCDVENETGKSIRAISLIDELIKALLEIENNSSESETVKLPVTCECAFDDHEEEE